MRGTLEGTGSLCNRGRALEKLGAGSGCQVACGVCPSRVSAFRCVWNVGGVSVCPLRVYPGSVSSRPAVLSSLSLDTKSRIYEGGRLSPQTGTPGSDQLVFPKTKPPGLREGSLSKTESSSLRRVRPECGPSFLPFLAPGSGWTSWT